MVLVSKSLRCARLCALDPPCECPRVRVVSSGYRVIDTPFLDNMTAASQLQELLAYIRKQADQAAQLEAAALSNCEWHLMSWSKPSADLQVALSVLATAANSISACSTRLTLLFKTSPSARDGAS